MPSPHFLRWTVFSVLYLGIIKCSTAKIYPDPLDPMLKVLPVDKQRASADDKPSQFTMPSVTSGKITAQRETKVESTCARKGETMQARQCADAVINSEAVFLKRQATGLLNRMPLRQVCVCSSYLCIRQNDMMQNMNII